MATINPDGVVPADLSDYISKINDIFTTVYGPSFSTDPETPQGQIIGLLAFALSQVDESLVNAVAGTIVNTAHGQQLDDIGSNIGVSRKDAVNSEVICQLTGVAGTVIPSGSEAKDTISRLYQLKEAVTIPAGLSVDGVMVIQLDGNIVIDSGTVTQIVTNVNGWETINNASAGVVGRSRETDAEYKRRLRQSIAVNSRTQISSIRTALLEIEDVSKALVQDNDQPFDRQFKNVTIPAHSVTAIVLGGDNQDIFNALGRKKPTGVPYNGDITGTYDDQSTYTFLDVKFYRPDEIQIQISIETNINSDFPSDGVDKIKQNIIDYFNGTLLSGDGFYQEGQKIGKDVRISRLYTPINYVVGHDVVSLQISKVGGTLGIVDIEINLNEIAIIEQANIAVTTNV